MMLCLQSAAAHEGLIELEESCQPGVSLYLQVCFIETFTATLCCSHRRVEREILRRSPPLCAVVTEGWR